MPAAFRCPECQQQLQIRDELLGMKIRCPKCKAVIAAPTAEELIAAELIPAQPIEDPVEEPIRAQLGRRFLVQQGQM